MPAISQIGIRRLGLALAIGLLLYLAYLLTFSGLIYSNDELIIIDTIDSIAIRGNLFLNATTYLRNLQTSDVEPAQPVLAIPLYWLAYHIPWVGNIHALLLFNPIITALTAILLFFFALQLGYTERTAIFAALLFGLSTIVWPYAKTFFREPLSMLSLFAAAFFLDRWRRGVAAKRRARWSWLALGLLTTLVALFSKEATLLALPVLLVLAVPSFAVLKWRRRGIIGVGIGLAVIVLLLVLAVTFLRDEFFMLSGRYNFLHRANALLRGLPDSGEGLAGYLISPGKSIWWYSPVLLLALGAPVVLPRERWRESWLLLAMLLWFAISYAAIRGKLWHGGASWGPRYMVPLTPFLMLAVLPLLDRILGSTRLWPKLVLGALAVAGVAIQIGGLYVNIHEYYDYMQASTGQAAWVGAGIWNPRWSQAIGSLLYIPQAEPDTIWLVREPDWIAFATIVTGLALVTFWLVRLHRNRSLSRYLGWTGIAGSLGLLTGLSLFLLWRAYDDPRYKGRRDALQVMHDYLADHVEARDSILLSSPNYAQHFMNYYKGTATWYTLPLSPGERYSPEQAPEVVSDRVEDLISPDAAGLMSAVWFGGVAYEGGRSIWMVVDHSSYVSWATRPAEWYMAQYGFSVGAVDISTKVRLVQFLSIRAPRPDSDVKYPVGARFGRVIQLIGYDLSFISHEATSDNLSPGDSIGVSLLWQTTAPLDTDYTVGVYILDADGKLILQQDRYPVGGFAPTSTWDPREQLRDNFGFILPNDLSPGTYQIWMVLYTWPSLERLPVSGPDGTNWGDHMVLHTIIVQ